MENINDSQIIAQAIAQYGVIAYFAWRYIKVMERLADGVTDLIKKLNEKCPLIGGDVKGEISNGN